jgi:hypothetical protein
MARPERPAAHLRALHLRHVSGEGLPLGAGRSSSLTRGSGRNRSRRVTWFTKTAVSLPDLRPEGPL